MLLTNEPSLQPPLDTGGQSSRLHLLVLGEAALAQHRLLLPPQCHGSNYFRVTCQEPPEPSYLPRDRLSTQVMEEKGGNYRAPSHRHFYVYEKGEGSKQIWTDHRKVKPQRLERSGRSLSPEFQALHSASTVTLDLQSPYCFSNTVSGTCPWQSRNPAPVFLCMVSWTRTLFQHS